MEINFIADDIVFGAAMNGSHGNHRRLYRFDLPADNSLQSQHNLRRQYDRIFRGVRIGAVSALAANFNVDKIYIGQSKPFANADFPCRDRRV